MTDLDPSLLTKVPIWVITTYVLVRTFAFLFSSFAPDFAKEAVNEIKRSRSHDDELEEVTLNHRLQEADAEQLRKAYYDASFIDMLKDNQEWQRELYKELTDAFKGLNNELRSIHLTNQRQNDLVTTLNIGMSELVDLHRNGKKL